MMMIMISTMITGHECIWDTAWWVSGRGRRKGEDIEG
jgi:hypothetical protein